METFRAVAKDGSATIPASPIVPDSHLSAAPAATTTIVYQTIQQPVIERIVETQRTVTQGGITETTLGDRLNQLENKLRSLIFSQGSEQSAQTSAVYNAVALSQRIDNLSNVTLTNPTITGGSVTATAFSGTLGTGQGGTGVTSAPSYGQLLVGNADGGYTLTATSSLGLGGSGANTGIANTWTALQLFSSGASSTLFSNFGTAYFGGTATTTIDAAGNIVGAGTISAGTTTITSLVSTNISTSTFAGGVQATALNLTGGATSTFANGVRLSGGCFEMPNGTCLSAGGGGGASLSAANSWTALQIFSAGASTTNVSVFDTAYFGGTATSTFDSAGNLSVAGTLGASGKTTLGYASTTGITAGYASTSNLVASNSFTLANLTGFLKATAGAVATALVDLASDVSGLLAVANGGTGWANLASGTVLLGNGSGALATTTRGNLTETGSSVLTITGGGSALLGSGATIQVAQSSGSASGFLSSADWTTFNAKQAALGFTPADGTRLINTTYPLHGGGDLTADRTLTLAFGTTTSNTWAGAQTFTNAPVFSALSGLLKGNGSSGLTVAVAGTDYVAPATTISAGSGLSGGGDLSTNRSISLDLSNANTWTALQSFANASTTRLSVFDRLYVGGTATTTIFGNATSTFGAGIETPYLNVTGTSATSTFANGVDLSAGCFSILGTCVGQGGSSQWTTSGSDIYFNTGSVLIGTTTPGRTLTVFNTAANAQQRISYDATRYAEFYVDASGDLQLTATGKNLRALDANLYLCDGGACPTTPVQGYPSSFTTNGNLVAGGTVYAGGFGPATCPSGMIPVPASAADGQQGFCVDKYETQSSSGNAVSVQGGSPWVSITQYDARAQCIRAGKHLITEKEWQAIAHNAENVGWNWNGGVAGTNQMSDGHSDNSPASALATAADSSPCSGTGQTCDLSTWDSQRRVYKLGNGEYIWDFGGNVWEWVDQANQEDYPIANSAAAGWQACSTSGDGICGNTRTTNDQWYRGGTAALRGFIRGGYWGNGAYDGAFTLDLNTAPGSAYTGIGFRCAR